MTEENLTFTVSLYRLNGKRVDTGTIQNKLMPIINKSTKGNRNNWSAQPFRISAPVAPENDGLYLYKTQVTYERNSNQNIDNNRLTNEMNEILNYLKEAGSSSAFGNYPWKFSKIENTQGWEPVDNPIVDQNDNNVDESNSNEMVDFDRALSLEEIEIPEVLINGSDSEIENHPAFANLYGRSAHIRVMASSIKTMKETNGMRRNHVLLYGLPGCAKSSLFKGMQQVIGHGGFLAINANSATRAGIESIFLKKLKETGVPPIVFIEEIEKTQETILTVWLSMMDERAEVRKITNKVASCVETRVLCFAAANDKILFDRLMGGRPGHPGALSSRFTKPLYVPRPNRDTMRRILLRDIKLYGGNPLWADKALEIADEVGTNDPRIILAYLDGGERLLNGKYKDDIMQIHNLEQEDNEKKLTENYEV